MVEKSSESDLVFLAFLVFSFFVFAGFADLYRPLNTTRYLSVSVLSDSTSSTGNTVTASPTPTPIDNSSSGSADSGIPDSGDTTTTIFSTPVPTSNPTSSTDTILSTTPTPYYDSSSSGTGGTYSDNSTTDRLATVDPATLSCIKSRLTSSEFDTLRYLVPTNSAEQETLKSLKEKAQICFAGYSEATNINQATGFLSELPIDSENCLKKALGDVSYKEISAGVRRPTLTEKTKAATCFSENTNKVMLQSQKQALSSDIDKCLVLALGTERLSKVKKDNTTLTLDEREKVQRCFGVSSNPLKPHVTYTLPDDVKKCLASTISDERLENLKLGKDKPTDAEKKHVKGCLANLNQVQTKMVPAPPEEVPFMNENPDIVQVKSSFTEKVVVDQKIEDKRLVLSGKGLKNTLVDLYIYSDPIVVTTETDGNGDFVYRMSEPLSAGNHIAYAVYKQNDGTSVRSAVYNFDVTAASDTKDNLLNENEVSTVPTKFMNYAVGFILLALGLSAVGMYFALKTKKPIVSGEGNSETKSGTGTIN